MIREISKTNLITTLLFGIMLAIGIALASAGSALADGGPHQGLNFGTTPDGCAGCHRAHTGVQDNLLNAGNTQAEFCFSCHGSGGTGADTDTQNGIYYSTRTTDFDEGAPPSVDDASLRGGGFSMAHMDTAASGTLSTTATTSTHSIDGSSGMIWGAGPINPSSDPGDTLTSLVCTNCHNPHGNGKYRILRPYPIGMPQDPTPSAIDVPDDASEGLWATTQSATDQDGGALSIIDPDNSIDLAFNNSVANATANFGDIDATWNFSAFEDS
ncbi:MAG: cytochrome c3 family protein, partial [Chloroflexota bacterium]|nr:cytochrome c3 family protein [Chloroflexota bacterium]